MAKLEEDVARFRGDVEVLRAALESQPPVEPKQIVDDVCAALEESNLETTDDAVVETTVPPTPHNSRTSLVRPLEKIRQLQAQREMIERAAEGTRTSPPL